jgi:catechol 2,3-dioxygenase-like lactoylglutathione lyase family enzyme
LLRPVALRLDHLVLGVSDGRASTDFCRDVLGVEVVELDRERVAFRFAISS